MEIEAKPARGGSERTPWCVGPCHVRLRDGTALLIRPTVPNDLPLMASNYTMLTREDIHQRFFEYLNGFPERLVRQVTKPGPRCDLALVAQPAGDETPSDQILGLVQLACMSHGDEAEYAIIVRHDWQGRGVGWVLTEAALREARLRGLSHIRAYVLPDNARMLRMLHEFGFTIRIDSNDPHVMRADLDLSHATGSPSSRR